MRPIVLIEFDKLRPAVILTRDMARSYLTRVTVAPITSTIRGIGSEIHVGPANGIDYPAVISCDNITTVANRQVVCQIGFLLERQEEELSRALSHAFDLAI